MFNQILDSALIDSIVRASIPILLAAMGGLLCERVGVFQVSLEGTMLIGAFTAVSISYSTGNAYLGVLAAGIAGAILSVILAVGRVSRSGDPIVIGVAINLFAVGLTGFLLPQLFNVRGVFQDKRVVGLSRHPFSRLAAGLSVYRRAGCAYCAAGAGGGAVDGHLQWFPSSR